MPPSIPCGAARRAAVLFAYAACAALAPHAADAQTAPPIAPPATLATATPGSPVPTPVPAVRATTGSPEPSPTATPPTGLRLAPFRLTARTVRFYSNRFIVGADDDVRVALGDGTQISGNTFYMDLRLNRFVVAGNVVVETRGKRIPGAAFAEYLDFDRAYFVPILAEPDRWTFVAGDYGHPALGREMPGDTFFLPDLSGERIFLTANRAVVDPRESVRFAPAKINFGPASPTFPSYFLDFSRNPYYAQNSLPGAYVDGPLDFAGGRHGLATAHVRYDSPNGVFPAVEAHQFSANSYFVGSVSPLTRPLKQYNFLGFDRISPGIQAQIAFQEIAFQHAFHTPLSATAISDLQLTGSLPHSYLQARFDQFYDSLLARPSGFIPSTGEYYYGDPSHNWIPDHPSDFSLSWVGIREQPYHLPLYYQLRSFVGFAHNGITPLQTLGGESYASEYDKGFGFNVTTRSIPVVRDRTGRRRDVYFTGSFDKQRTYFSLPHHVDITTTNLSLTKFVNPQKLAIVLAYTNQNTSDFFGAQQTDAYAGYANAINPFTGQPYPALNGFRGFATTRSFDQQIVYTPNPGFALNLTMRENRDYPRPIPGFLQLIGDGVNFANYGATPYQATAEVRYRFSPQLVIDVSRSYYFNFAGYQRWQPQFSVQIEK